MLSVRGTVNYLRPSMPRCGVPRKMISSHSPSSFRLLFLSVRRVCSRSRTRFRPSSRVRPPDTPPFGHSPVGPMAPVFPRRSYSVVPSRLVGPSAPFVFRSRSCSCPPSVPLVPFWTHARPLLVPVSLSFVLPHLSSVSSLPHFSRLDEGRKVQTEKKKIVPRRRSCVAQTGGWNIDAAWHLRRRAVIRHLSSITIRGRWGGGAKGGGTTPYQFSGFFHFEGRGPMPKLVLPGPSTRLGGTKRDFRSFTRLTGSQPRKVLPLQNIK